jgi:heat shock protein HslJ
VANSLSRGIRRLSLVLLVICASLVVGGVAAAKSIAREATGVPLARGPVALQADLNGLGSEAARFGAQSEALLDGMWRLDSYSSDGFLTPVMDGTLVTASFERDGTVSGNASCNSFSGSYRATAITISIGPLATTRMACDRDVMDQEQGFLDALESAGTYTVQATTLTLGDADGTPVAIFGKGLLSSVLSSSEDF